MVFTALHGMPALTRVYKKAVCLSVKHVDCEKQKKDLSRFLYHTKDHLAEFSEKNGWWRRPHLPEILGQADPIVAKSPIFS